ncbi:WD40 repeat-like protein, partial [Gymnopus androsaceus JB14]
IVSGSDDKTVRIWDANTGAQIGDPLHGHDHWVNSVAFSTDGTRIVSGSHDKTVRIWDANTGAQIGDPLHGHDDWVSSVAFSPDGTKIVSGSEDRTVRVHCNSQSFQGRFLLLSQLVPQQFLLISVLAHHYWSLSHNGWIKFPNSSPNVIWIPPQFHQLLWRPQNTCIVSRKGYTKLSFLDCVYGEHWINCIELEE